MNLTINQFIAWLTATLVLFVALGSFALSYYALQEVATTNGIPGQLSYIWPLLIDFSLIVFSLCAVTSYLYGESTWRQWALVAGYTLATIAFNAIHAYPQALSPLATRIIVTCVPPLSLFLSFEILMSQLKSSVTRRKAQQTLAQLTGVVSERQEQLAQMDNAFCSLQEKLAAVQSQIDSLNAPKDEVVTRREKVLALISNGKTSSGKAPTQKELAELVGVSIQTIRGDIKALNGKVQQ